MSAGSCRIDVGPGRVGDRVPRPEYRDDRWKDARPWCARSVWSIAAQQLHGDEVVGKLYTALGTRFHNNGEGPTREAIAGALKDVGLPEDLADFADKDTYDTELRASHTEGIEKVGQDVGTPVIAVPGPTGEEVAFFGPVVTPTPRGDAAARLWDGTLLVASTPGFYEIKRTRTAAPSFE
ncbi:Thioredoxin-like reductase [Streptomyces tanashiensis]